MWDRIENRLALMELVLTGRLRCRKSQKQAWQWLAELSWTRRANRQDEIVQARPEELVRLLNQIWPDWQLVGQELEAAGLPISEQGWKRLQEIKHSRTSIQLPESLNQRTALAQVSAHSKTSMSQIRRTALEEVLLTHDGVIRIRPSQGLLIRRANECFDASAIADLLGEVVISERALASGTWFAGDMPETLLTVENLGPFQDIDVPPTWMVAHVPGWDTRTARMVLELLPQVTTVHFGDIDPNGLRIYRHLCGVFPRLRWVIPSFWTEYVETKGLPADWPSDLDLTNSPPLVRHLASKGLWLEQEAIVLDPRMLSALINAAVE